jgi:hypothetical protein
MSSITPIGSGPIPGIEDFIRGLNQVTATAPAIAGAVASVAAIWQTFTGQTVSLTDLAELIEKVVHENRTFGEAEVLRLRAEIAAAILAPPPTLAPLTAEAPALASLPPLGDPNHPLFSGAAQTPSTDPSTPPGVPGHPATALQNAQRVAQPKPQPPEVKK